MAGHADALILLRFPGCATLDGNVEAERTSVETGWKVWIQGAGRHSPPWVPALKVEPILYPLKDKGDTWGQVRDRISAP